MGFSDFKKGYQPRANIVKMSKVIWMTTDSHSIFASWRNHSSQLLNVHGVKDVKHTEIHTAEPLVPEPSAFQVEMAIEKLKRHKSLGVDQIPAELIKAESRTFRSETHKLTNSNWNKDNCLSSGRSRSLYLFIEG